MQVDQFPSSDLLHFDKLIQDYLAKNEKLSPFISHFPSIENFRPVIAGKQLSTSHRRILSDVLTEQYRNHHPSAAVSENIDLLREEKTFTVTTGHQLCLFTGPLYFIYKMLSTIKLSRSLKKSYPDLNIVPVYWLASEDHDFDEINHAFFYGKKLEWHTEEKGAVGPMDVTTVLLLVDELKLLLGNDAASIVDLLRSAYTLKDLSNATRHIVNHLFGKYGLVILDANHPGLKGLFRHVMKDELFHGSAYEAVSASSAALQMAGYKTQVNPRGINLFYHDENLRARIERSGDKWKVIDTELAFSESELNDLLNSHPEKFSPNVIMRPLYQETILPNLAYIGGPGELAYWLQLRSLFEKHETHFPILVLRDSAMLITEKTQSRLEKIGIAAVDLFKDRNDLIKGMVNASEASLEKEKEALNSLFDDISARMKAVDVTLENAARGEGQRQLSALEGLEKKMLKALKAKEDTRIQQLEKLMTELFPDGQMQERHDNFFQYSLQFGEDLLDVLLNAFDPLANRLTIVSAV